MPEIQLGGPLARLYPAQRRPLALIKHDSQMLVGVLDAVARRGDGSVVVGRADGSIVIYGPDLKLYGALHFAHRGAPLQRIVARGELVFSGDKKGRLCVYSQGKAQLLPSPHTSPIIDLVLSPDGQTLISSGGEHDHFLWSVGKRQVIRKLGGEQVSVDGTSVQLNSLSHFVLGDGGVRLALDNHSKTLVVWGGNNAAPHVLETIAPREEKREIVLAGRSVLVMTTHLRELEIERYDFAGKLLHTKKIAFEGEPSLWASAPAAKRIVVEVKEELLGLDLDGKEAWRVPWPKPHTLLPHVMIDNHHLLDATSTASTLLDVRQGRFLQKPPPSWRLPMGWVRTMACSTDASWCALSDDQQTFIREPDGSTWRFPYQSESLWMSDDGSLVLGRTGTLVWGLEPKTRLMAFERPIPGSNGSQLIVRGNDLWIMDSDHLLRLDAHTGRTTSKRKFSASTYGMKVAMSPDGKWMAFSNRNQLQIRPMSDESTFTFDDKDKREQHVLIDWSEAGLLMADTHGDDAKIFIVNPQSGAPVRSLGISLRSQPVHLSRDGRWLVTTTAATMQPLLLALMGEQRIAVDSLLGPASEVQLQGEHLLVGRNGLAEIWRFDDLRRQGAATLVPAPPPSSAVRLHAMGPSEIGSGVSL